MTSGRKISMISGGRDLVFGCTTISTLSLATTIGSKSGGPTKTLALWQVISLMLSVHLVVS